MLERAYSISPCIVSYKGSLCKIKKLNYIPDANGLVAFKVESLWSVQGINVGAMIELLKRYRSEIHSLTFDTIANTTERLVNVKSDVMIGTLECCIIIVGDGSASYTKYDNTIGGTIINK